MFYNNQQSYPHQPYYPQDQEQQYQEQPSENQEQETQHQELQYSQNPYVTQQTQETRYQQNPYVTQQTQETQHQQNPYVSQQTQEARYQQNPYVTQHVPETQHQQNPYVAQQAPYQQPQMYQPYHDPRVSPPAPTLDSTQPQTLPTGSTTGIPTEPTEQQIQQVVGTQFLSLKKPILDFVKPWVEYGMNEAKYTSPQHAMTEVAAIMFLVGKGFNPTIAHYIVESWEKNEQF
ncbi:hypothetical protein V7183_15965 [Bacillus sp. JJ1127]|uniref:hypothetical protein n=1 Tax=Bacillus sp. JJ1127 TaxID=3122952 RepID=UPI002FFE4DC1